MEVFTATAAAFADLVAVLHPTSARLKDGADFLREFIGLVLRKIQERQAGDDRADGFNGRRQFGEQPVQFPRVAGDDVGVAKTFTEVLGEVGIEFDGDEAVFAQTAFEEGVGDGAGAGAEFEDETVGIVREPAGHGSAELR